jgi:hypothetical protein
MRVYVEEDMTVCLDGHVLPLRAGETVEGPLARYLLDGDCNVTVEEDDSPAPAAKPARTSRKAKTDQAANPAEPE